MTMTREEASQILGIPYDATQKQVNDAYRKAIAKYHPDANRNKSPEEQKNAESMFKKCAQAKKVMLSKEPEQPRTQQIQHPRPNNQSRTRSANGSYNAPYNTRSTAQSQPTRTQQERPVHNTAHSFHDNVPKVIDDAERQISGFYQDDAKRRYQSPLDLSLIHVSEPTRPH